MSTVPRIGVSTVSYLFKGLFQTPREGYFQIITGILALDQGLAFIGVFIIKVYLLLLDYCCRKKVVLAHSNTHQVFLFLSELASTGFNQYNRT